MSIQERSPILDQEDRPLSELNPEGHFLTFGNDDT